MLTFCEAILLLLCRMWCEEWSVSLWCEFFFWNQEGRSFAPRSHTHFTWEQKELLLRNSVKVSSLQTSLYSAHVFIEFRESSSYKQHLRAIVHGYLKCASAPAKTPRRSHSSTVLHQVSLGRTACRPSWENECKYVLSKIMLTVWKYSRHRG